MTTGELIGRIYDLSANKLMRMAVEIKEYPNQSKVRYHDFPAVKAAFEKVLDIRGPERQRVIDYYFCKSRYGEIKNDAGLRMAYEMLGILQELDGKREGLEISIKRAIREYSQKPSTWEIRRIVKDEGLDGYTELVMLPAFDSEAGAEDFFRERYNAYGWGFVQGVDAAFREQEEDHKDWGLVLVVPQAVTDSMKDMGKKSSFGKDKNNHAADKAAGFQEGRKFDPTRRVAGEPERMALGGAC